MSKDPQGRFELHPDAAWRNVEGHIFIITADSRQHELAGPVEHCVWSLCDAAPKTITEMLDVICEEFDVERKEASADLNSFLKASLSAGILKATTT
jgi:hypothetical protein